MKLAVLVLSSKETNVDNFILLRNEIAPQYSPEILSPVTIETTVNAESRTSEDIKQLRLDIAQDIIFLLRRERL